MSNEKPQWTWRMDDSLGICLCKIKLRGILINIYLIQKDKCKTVDEDDAFFQ